jgi:hypothetical protein
MAQQTFPDIICTNHKNSSDAKNYDACALDEACLGGRTKTKIDVMSAEKKISDEARKVRQPPIGVWEALEEEFLCLDLGYPPGQLPANDPRKLPEEIECPSHARLIEGHLPDRSKVRDKKLAELYQRIYEKNGNPRPPRTALCLSGGGIRSATFGLGVIQGLARAGLLESFDYLSTVSGGGYIGSWLSAWIQRKGITDVIRELNSIPVELSSAEKTQKQTDGIGAKVDPEPKAIQHLRSYSNYLTPRLGLLTADTWSLIATYLRNLLLNWLVLIPLLAAVLMVPRAALVSLRWENVPRWAVLGAMLLATVGGIKMMAYADSHRPSVVREREKKTKAKPRAEREDERHFLLGGLAPLVGAIIFTIAFGLWARHSPDFIRIGEWLQAKTPFSLSVWCGVLGVGLVMIAWLCRFHPNKTLFEGGVLLVCGFFSGWLLWQIFHAMANPVEGYPKILQDVHLRHALYACFAGPFLLVLLFAFSSVLIGLVSGFTDDEDREWWARAAAWVFIAAVVWAGFSALVIFGPYLLLFGAARAPKMVASLGGLSGLIAILVGKSGKTTSGKGNAGQGQKSYTNMAAAISTALAAPIFTAFLLIIIALASTAIVDPGSFRILRDGYLQGLGHWHPGSYLQIIEGSHWSCLLGFVLMALVISVGMSLWTNVNKFSMHAMYRNRLTRAYLGASRDRTPDLFSDFQMADNLDMKDLAPAEGQVQRPFHVLSATLNLTSGSRLSWQNRRAESFTISPLHGGSLRLGYRRVGEYSSVPATPFPTIMKRPEPSRGLTLGTAMTISGAAVSPNMGYHSSPLVAFLLTLFNVRLGWWLGNPGSAGDTTFTLASPRIALRPLISELLGQSDDTSPYVMLSDGGHFENLGLYEMVLRRCRLIVLSDAGEDPAYSFEDLSNALTKIHTDLGVPIEFTDQVPISKFDPKKARAAGNKDQLGGKYCAIGIIRYSSIDLLDSGEPAPDGTLIYLKPTLIGQEPADLLHYAHSNPAFPHEPTLDEFYSEAQFESYRVLGSHMIEYLCGKKWDVAEAEPLERFVTRAGKHAEPKKAVRKKSTS